MRLAHTLLLVSMSATLWAADPFLGVWKLDLRASKFQPQPAPRSTTMKWESTAQGFLVTSTGIGADGRPVHSEYVATYDGQEHATPGPWNFDAVINRQISENHREDIFKKAGKVAGRVSLVVSADGKTLTMKWDYGELQDVRVFGRE